MGRHSVWIDDGVVGASYCKERETGTHLGGMSLCLLCLLFGICCLVAVWMLREGGLNSE